MDSKRPKPSKQDLKDAFKHIESIVHAIESPLVSDGRYSIPHPELRWWHHLIEHWSCYYKEEPDYIHYAEALKWCLYYSMESGSSFSLAFSELQDLQRYTRTFFPRNVILSMSSTDDVSEPALR